MALSTHDYVEDPRNRHILVWVNGELVPRERAVVSVFDSGFILGDGVWEGLRVSQAQPAFLDAHLDRLEEGAAAIMLDIGLTRVELAAALYTTLRANDMTDGVHIRLMVTRGVKSTPYQDPRATIGAATVDDLQAWLSSQYVRCLLLMFAVNRSELKHIKFKICAHICCI